MNQPARNGHSHFKKIVAIVSVTVSFLLLSTILACNIWIITATKSQVFSDIPSLPVNRDGLVLATGKLIEKGRINQHFVRRVDAAAALYHAGKVQRLILSGDKGHDEPMELKRALLARGVPESALVLDNYGLRTLDSVVRARDVFQCGNLTIISERFHDFRALFLSRYYGINAVAYAPADLPFRWMIRSTIRESLARVKAVLDLYILKTKPTVASTGDIPPLTQTHPAVTPADPERSLGRTGISCAPNPTEPGPRNQSQRPLLAVVVATPLCRPAPCHWLAPAPSGVGSRRRAPARKGWNQKLLAMARGWC